MSNRLSIVGVLGLLSLVAFAPLVLAATSPIPGQRIAIQQADNLGATFWDWMTAGFLLLGGGCVYGGYSKGKKAANRGDSMAGPVIEGSAVGGAIGLIPAGLIQAHQAGTQGAPLDFIMSASESRDVVLVLSYLALFFVVRQIISMRREHRWKTASVAVQSVSRSA